MSTLPATPSARALFAALSLAVVTFSAAAPSARLAQPLDPMWLATYRLGIAGLAWILLSPRTCWETARILFGRPRLALGVAATMVVLAVHIAAWMASLALTSVLRCAVLTATAPLFAGVLSTINGERPNKNFAIGCVLALAGVLAMAYYGQDNAAPTTTTLPLAVMGDLLAVLSALTVAVYLYVGRKVRQALPLPGYLAFVNFGSAMVLATYAALHLGLDQARVAGPSQLLALLVLGLVPGVIGHGLLNWSVRYLPVHIASLSTLLEPVGASILAYFLLDETIVPAEAMGAAALLVGVAVGSRGR